MNAPITGAVWLNGQGQPMATLVMPDGTHAILAIPHRNVAGQPESSQAFRVIMAALSACKAAIAEAQ
jgi:hypothetical protein